MITSCICIFANNEKINSNIIIYSAPRISQQPEFPRMLMMCICHVDASPARLPGGERQAQPGEGGWLLLADCKTKKSAELKGANYMKPQNGSWFYILNETIL